MGKRDFSLQPFRSAPYDLKIGGYVARHANRLEVRYEITGDLQMIDIPGRKREASRVKGLWENTCLELFLAARDCDRYWEVNLCPSGDWNVFRFDRYDEERSADKLVEEVLFNSLPVRIQKGSGSFSLAFEFSLDGIIQGDQVIEVGVSAVTAAPKTYWALAHCGSMPNFHIRDSFTINL